jgi:hypothetical protein
MLSSVSVFGEANIPAIDITPANPVNQYGLDKINLESYFKENLKDSKIFFLRISNLYGFTRSSGIVSYLLKQFLLKGPVDIDGGPSWVRNFVSFNFLKLAIERMITNQHKFSENHNWLNMASNWNIELSNLIHVICEELDWFPIINFSIENPNQIHTSQILPSDKLELLNLPAEHFNFFRNYIIKFKKTDSGKLFQW